MTKLSKLFLLFSILFCGIIYYLNNSTNVNTSLSTQSSNQYIIQATDLINHIQLYGRIIPCEILDITAATNAKINKVHVQPGQRVIKDQLLLELESDQLEIDIRNAQESLIKSQMEYQKKQSWGDSDEVFQSKQNHLKNKLNFQKIHELYTQNLILYKQGIIAGNELQQSELASQDAKLNLALSERHLQQIINLGSNTQLKLTKLSLENALAKMAILQKVKDKLIIKSPINGVILRANKIDNTSSNTKFLSPGQNVNLGESLLSVGSSDGFAVNITVDEKTIQNINLDQKVTITIPALKHADKFQGVIKAIDIQPKDNETINSPPKYSLKIITPQILVNDKILLGMTAQISFNFTEKSGSLLIPISSIAYDHRNKPYVLKFNKHDNTYIPQSLELGQTTSDKIEILAGLSIGDIINITSTT